MEVKKQRNTKMSLNCPVCLAFGSKAEARAVKTPCFCKPAITTIKLNNNDKVLTSIYSTYPASIGIMNIEIIAKTVAIQRTVSDLKNSFNLFILFYRDYCITLRTNCIC